jgi:hypothetical protein
MNLMYAEHQRFFTSFLHFASHLKKARVWVDSFIEELDGSELKAAIIFSTKKLACRTLGIK